MDAYIFAEKLAEKTHAKLQLCSQKNFQIDERAITADIFCEYFNSKPSGVGLASVGNESATGLDMEIWVCSGRRWHRYAAQSKIIHFKESTYRQLNHRVRGRFQIDILLDFAAKNRAFPVYLLYTCGQNNWQCKLPFSPEQLGISAVGAQQIKSTMCSRGWRRADKIHGLPGTVPWRCLFCCPDIYKITGCTHPIIGPSHADNIWEEQELPRIIQGIRTRDITHLSHLPEEYLVGSDGYFPKTILVVDSDVT